MTREFGNPVQGAKSRAAAYAVIGDGAGRFLVARARPGLFLPGGGKEGDESAEATIVREVLEEVGMASEVGHYLGTSVQWFIAEGVSYRMTADFFTASVHHGVSADREHEVLWMTREELRGRMYHQCHEWALDQVSERG